MQLRLAGGEPHSCACELAGPLGAGLEMAAVGRWWALVVAVALLVGPGRVVANTEGESADLI